MSRLEELIHRSGKPLLQVALDFTLLEDALRVVRAVWGLPIGIIEVGTPLIKSEGMKSVSIVKSLLWDGDTLVLADTKTADVGGIEAELSLRSGADVMTVLGSSDDEVIKAAITACRASGAEVIVDMIGFKDAGALFKRVNELQELGVRVVNLHVGIDVQKKLGVTASALVSLVKELKKAAKGGLLISVSGGIKPGEVGRFAEAGADIVVIGSAITRSPDPRGAAIKALKGLGYAV